MSKSVLQTPRRPSRLKQSIQRQFPFYLMMIPGLFFMFILCYLPMPGVIIAFKNYDARLGIWGSEWMDPLFKNFEFFFKSDTALTITFNTIFYNLLEMFLVTVGAVALAILLNEIGNKVVSATYKGIILLPTFLSWIIIQYIVYSFLCTDKGIINNYFGLDINWYYEAGYWRFIMPFAYFWKNIGYYSVLYVAAIAGISGEYYEAAELDGASKWQQIRYVTLPLLRPTIIILCLLWVGKLFSGGLGDWNGFYSITNNSGMLYSTTDVIDTYVFRSLKTLNDYGMTSAAGLYQSMVGLILVVVSNGIIRKIDPDSALF